MQDLAEMLKNNMQNGQKLRTDMVGMPPPAPQPVISRASVETFGGKGFFDLGTTLLGDRGPAAEKEKTTTVAPGNDAQADLIRKMAGDLYARHVQENRAGLSLRELGDYSRREQENWQGGLSGARTESLSPLGGGRLGLPGFPATDGSRPVSTDGLSLFGAREVATLNSAGFSPVNPPRGAMDNAGAFSNTTSSIDGAIDQGGSLFTAGHPSETTEASSATLGLNPSAASAPIRRASFNASLFEPAWKSSYATGPSEEDSSSTRWSSSASAVEDRRQTTQSGATTWSGGWKATSETLYGRTTPATPLQPIQAPGRESVSSTTESAFKLTPVVVNPAVSPLGGFHHDPLGDMQRARGR